MRARFFSVLIALCPAMFIASGLSQTVATGNTPRPARTQRQPFTAEFKITSVQTLADGTTITRESTEIEAQDAEGRRLNSTTEQTPDMARAPGTSVRVNDPGGGLQASWDSRTNKARVVKLPPAEQRHGCWANEAGNYRMSWYEGPRPGRPAPNANPLPNGGALVPAQRDKPEIEDLGTTSIQGVEARGQRITRTIPAGEIGNSRPIVSVTEMWSSPKLGFALREIRDDPRTGKRSRELVNLTMGDPDPALFQPPEGYEVTEEELHEVPCPAQPR